MEMPALKMNLEDSENQFQMVRLVRAGLSNWTTLHRFKPGKMTVEGVGFQFCMSGEGVIVIDNQPYTMKSGMGILLFDGEIFHVPEADEKFSRFYSYFQPEGKGESYTPETFPFLESNRILRTINSLEMIRLCREILDNVIRRHDPYAMMIARGLYNVLLGRMLKESAANETSPADMIHPEIYRQLVKVRTYIEQHFGEDISLDDLAKHSGFSKAHFIRLFRDFTSYTPHQFLIHCRMEYARLRLEERIAPVKEIAEEVGYSEVSHFCRTFKKWTGFSPATYRERVRGGDPSTSGIDK